MKRYLGFILSIIVLTVGAFTTLRAQSPTGLPTVEGKWKIAWIYSITNGEKSEGSAPLIAAWWTFGADGRYRIDASVVETGAYKLQDAKTLRMDADKPLTPDFDIRDYGIEKLTFDSLILSIPIMVTESFSMVNYTVFVRQK